MSNYLIRVNDNEADSQRAIDKINLGDHGTWAEDDLDVLFECNCEPASCPVHGVWYHEGNRHECKCEPGRCPLAASLTNQLTQ